MPVTNPSEIKIATPSPMYRCDGAESHAPDACEKVHFQEDDGGYKEPNELFYLQASHDDTEWTGFFCGECVDAIEKVKTDCGECGRENGAFEKSQVTLDQVLKARAGLLLPA